MTEGFTTNYIDYPHFSVQPSGRLAERSEESNIQSKIENHESQSPPCHSCVVVCLIIAFMIFPSGIRHRPVTFRHLFVTTSIPLPSVLSGDSVTK
ncbi:hypothetical protein K9N50_07245 [bacterium]|nr:hypothetical protein [bacterium]